VRGRAAEWRGAGTNIRVVVLVASRNNPFFLRVGPALPRGSESLSQRPGDAVDVSGGGTERHDEVVADAALAAIASLLILWRKVRLPARRVAPPW
jgi:hypothetical protein